MMNSPTRSPSAHTPPACAPFAALLPLATAHLLDDDQQSRLSAHIASCSHCQAELDLQQRIDQGLRRLEAVQLPRMAAFTAQQIAQIASGTASMAREGHPAQHMRASLHAPRASVRQRGILARTTPYAAVAAIVIVALALFGIPGLARNPTSRGGRGSTAIGKDTQLTGIAMLPAGTGWAIGSDSNNRAALFHYTGGQWRAEGLPAGLPANAALHSIAMLSESEGWAVGGAFVSSSTDGTATARATATPLTSGVAIGRIPGATSVLLHDAGGQWTVAQTPFAADLTQVVLRTASDGWAVGITAGQDGLLLHYDGTTWTRVQSPAFAGEQLNGVSAVAADDVWLTGRLHDASSVILHFNGAIWQRQEGIDLSEAALSSIQMVSANEGWAVGGYCSCKYARDVPTSTLSGALILHYQAGVWTFQSSSHPDRYLGDFIFALAMVSPTDGWAVGFGSTILHYSLGSWSPAASPSHLPPGATHVSPSLLSISMVSASEGWAVGDQGTLLHFSNGDWEAA